MAVIIGFSALGIAIVGWVAWFMSVKGDKPWAEFFKYVFFCGFLAFCMSVASQLSSCNANASVGGSSVKVGK